jgi:hypothetical protein
MTAQENKEAAPVGTGRDPQLTSSLGDSSKTEITAPACPPQAEFAGSFLADRAEHIRMLGKRVIADVIEIGRLLVECRDHPDMKHGDWLPWLERELGWSDQQARRFIHVYELSHQGKFNKLLNLDLPISGLYLLAAPSTPEVARAEVIARAEAGEKLKHNTVKKIIFEKKNLTRPGGRADCDPEDSVAPPKIETPDIEGKSAPPNLRAVCHQHQPHQISQMLNQAPVAALTEALADKGFSWFRTVMPAAWRDATENFVLNRYAEEGNPDHLLTKILRTTLSKIKIADAPGTDPAVAKSNEREAIAALRKIIALLASSRFEVTHITVGTKKAITGIVGRRLRVAP